MEKIQIGKVVGTHALKGELKIRSNGNLAKDCLIVGNFVNIQNILFEIATCRIHKTNFLVSFKDYQDINLVEKYIGSSVFVDQDAIVIEEDMYLGKEIMKCNIYIDNKLIGKVSDIIDNGRHDVLVVKNNNKKIMIPYVDAFIEKEDIENQRIDVRMIEGLI